MNPVILIILDGFGLSPLAEGNAIVTAKTPWFDWAVASARKGGLHASGAEVGLPWGEMGNSEVGHFNIGTGRIVMQDLPRIDRAIEDRSFFSSEVLRGVATHVRSHKSTLHVIGLASAGGVHAHLAHMVAMLEFAKQKGLPRVALHLIADGRDTPPQQLGKDLPTIEAALRKSGNGAIASISGRYYAMDRDKRWDRTQAAYQAIRHGKGRTAVSPTEALAAAKAAKETDEFVTPTVITSAAGKPVAPIADQDAVIFTNYRPDRARQLADALTMPEFTAFPRHDQPVSLFASFGSYGGEASPFVKVAFFAPPVSHQLAAVVAAAKLPQTHIAETEKYAHVTYFLNGGQEEAFAAEERVLVPSPKVATYDTQPEMSAKSITAKLLRRLTSKPPALLVANFANPDMVGHTGNLPAAVRAVETVDTCLAEIVVAAKKQSALMLVTADHGNAEQMINPETHEIDKEHTTNPVPLLMIEPNLTYTQAAVDPAASVAFAAAPPVGVLADVAPTILDLLGLEKPDEMTGQSLKALL